MLSLAALADPTRRQIVELLAEGERSAGDIVAKFPMSAPAISQHLKVLRDAKLVTSRVEGQRRIQSLDREGFAELESWVAQVKRLWERRLDALEHELRTEQSAERTRKVLRKRTIKKTP